MMKKLLFTVLIMFAIMSQIFAQAPQSFKYQAVVRDGAGTVLANQTVGFQLSILQTSETGNSVYTETFTKTTNSYGLVNLLIGEGTPVSGDFSTIDWGADSYFLEVELDETGGTSYVFIGTSKLNSVPYALNAKTAETAGNVFSGDYGDLSNTPDLSNYDTDVTDDFDGDYNSLSNQPTLIGDVTGDIDNNTVEKIQGKNVSITTPSSGQVLKWNGTEWAPGNDDVTGGSGVDGVVNSASFSGTNNKTLTLGISNGLTLTANFTDEVNDADADATNEIQILNISNDTIYLSDGGYVKLPAGFDGDYNSLSNTPDLSNYDTDVNDDFDGDYNSLSNTPTIPSNTSDLINDSGFITNADDADADATNELNTSVVLNGTDLQITDAGGTKTVDLSSLDNAGTDSQTLSVSGTSLTISGGNTITLQDNVDDADADATNEIQTLTEVLAEGNNAGTYSIDMNSQNITNAHILGLGSDPSNYLDLYYGSIRDYYDNYGTDGQVLTSHVLGANSYVRWETPIDADEYNELQVLNFSNDTLYLSDGGQVYMGQYSNLWEAHGNDIYNKNTRNVGVGLENPEGKLVVQGDSAVSDTLPLFEVKNKDGQTVFAVYDGGVRVYVNDDPAKANNDKSGFAIGGYRLDKSLTNEYLRVTPDSVRVYIKEENTNKANNKKGGFAIGGYRLDKTVPEEYLNVYAADTAYVIDTTAQMLWYPLKEAFLAGKILVESGDSVGQNSWATGYVSKSIGDYSQALGNQARAFGNSSTAIGYHANSIGSNSYSFGNYATAQDSGSYAIGSGAKATGLRSFAIGSTGVDSAGAATNSTIASGEYAYAFGMGAKSSGQGAFAIGTETEASGDYSTAIGYKSKAQGTDDISIGKDNITNGGFAFGKTNNVYSGWAGGGIAFGMSNEATGNLGYGMSIGWSNYTKGGIFALAMGYDNKMYGTNSYVFGIHATVGSSSTSVENSVLFNLENTTPTLTQNNTFSIMGAQLAIGTLSPSELVDIYGDTPNIEISNNLETESGIIFDDIQDPNNQWAKILYDADGNSLNFYNRQYSTGGTIPQFTVSPYGVKVGNGSTMKKVQQGSYYAGPNNSGGVHTVIINFPSSFSGTPRVNVTVKGGDYDDVFAVTTRQVSSTSFKVNIYRVDSPGGVWAQGLYIDWMAWE